MNPSERKTFAKLGVPFGGPNNKDYNILGSTLGVPLFCKIACRSLLEHRVAHGAASHLASLRIRIWHNIIQIVAPLNWVAVKELKLSYHKGIYIVNNRVSPI